MTTQPPLAILHSVARTLSSSIHLEQILNEILSQVAELLQLETGWIFLLDEQQQPYMAASQNLPPGLSQEPRRMEGSCYCLDMFHAGALHRAENVSIIACSRLYKLDATGADGLRFHASIPLQASHQPLGVLNVASRQRQALSQDELHTLYTIGDLLSLAIQRTRYYEEHLDLSALTERYRLARELHDSLGQGLAALIMRLETVDALLDKQAPSSCLKPHIQESVSLARKTLREARSSVQNLRTTEPGLDLESALMALSKELLGNLEVTLDIEPHLKLSPALTHSLYRMLQELITNIYKHAQAQQATICLKRENAHLSLQVGDDGQGFEPSAVAEGHFGLIGLRERVNLLQGQLMVCSQPNQGTLIRIYLPGEPR